MGLGVAILLLANNAVGFEILDTTEEEWVAPGYQVTEEAVIDPLEYGEPFSNDGEPCVGVHLSFAASDSGEAWRVVFVLDRKVVVLEEGADPVEIPVDLGIESCAFSPSGRFVLVHDGAEEYTGRNAARIDTGTGMVEIFDSQPEGRPGSRLIQVSDDGSATIGLYLLDSGLNVIASYRDIANCWPSRSATGDYFAIAEGYGWRVHLLDRTGAEIWSRSTSGTLSDDMVFSPDETLLAVPLNTGLEVWEINSGETIWKDASGAFPITPLFDASDNTMIVRGRTFEFFEDLLNNSPAQSLENYDGIYNSWSVIDAEFDRFLLEMESTQPHLRRRTLVEPGNEVIWMSSASEIIPLGPLSQSGRAFRYDTSSFRFVLSPSGESVGLAPGEVIRFLSIVEVD